MSKAKPKKSLRRFGCLGGILCVAFLFPVGFWFMLQPPSLPLNSPEQVTLTKGEGAYVIGKRLEKAGIIRNAWCFAVVSRLRRQPILPGTYDFSGRHSAIDILRQLARGTVQNSKFITIPEGFTLKQIAERMAALKFVSEPERFIEAARGDNDKLSPPFPLPSGSLEGYLFPDTYQFSLRTNSNVIVSVMVRQFAAKFFEPRRDVILRSGHSLHELVTIASLVEREAEIPEDRAKIAGVIENRLRKKMRLQIDATVIYALGEHKSRVLYGDLKVDSPYNTYKHSGLPPGPIASPGLPSLLAALYPESHDYLYYVMGTGKSHVFAKTELEHNRNVAAYRRYRAERLKERLSH